MLDDYDVEAFAGSLAAAAPILSGQICAALTRVIVTRSRHDPLVEALGSAFRKIRVGDPFDPDTDIGPLATPQIVSDIEKQVQQSIAAGARLLTGGRRLGERGNFYAPTVLADIPENAPAACEETFGPVASLFRVRDIAEAIATANATTFGLGAAVWTNDSAETARLVDGIESGQVFVNAMVASTVELPFGGTKRSGYGRELSALGIREFCEAKSVFVA